MSVLETLKAQAAQAAEVGVNMTEVEVGGGGRLLPAGYALGRLVEYVELGKQPQSYNGEAKADEFEVQLGFALWGKGVPDPANPGKYLEGSQVEEDDGSPYIIRPFPIKLSRNSKAKAFNLFKVMNWTGKHTHFGQMLGEAFLIPIIHKDVPAKDGQAARKVHRVDLDKILPPLDQLSKQPYPVPQAEDKLYRAFFWDFPTKEAWASLYVEGKYENGDSKNVLQEKIMAAKNYAGSPLDVLLSGGLALPRIGETPAEPAAEAPAVPAGLPALPVIEQDAPAPLPTLTEVAPLPALV